MHALDSACRRKLAREVLASAAKLSKVARLVSIGVAGAVRVGIDFLA